MADKGVQTYELQELGRDAAFTNVALEDEPPPDTGQAPMYPTGLNLAVIVPSLSVSVVLCALVRQYRPALQHIHDAWLDTIAKRND